MPLCGRAAVSATCNQSLPSRATLSLLCPYARVIAIESFCMPSCGPKPPRAPPPPSPLVDSINRSAAAVSEQRQAARVLGHCCRLKRQLAAAGSARRLGVHAAVQHPAITSMCPRHSGDDGAGIRAGMVRGVDVVASARQLGRAIS